MISATRLSLLGVAFTKPSGFVDAQEGDVSAYVSGSFALRPVKWYSGTEWVRKPLRVYVE